MQYGRATIFILFILFVLFSLFASLLKSGAGTGTWGRVRVLA
jgi:hypothetical protein